MRPPCTVSVLVVLLCLFTLPALSQPVISGLSPSSATAGSPTFELTVNGTGFQAGAVVKWNGTSLGVSLWSANQLVALVPSVLVAAPGTASVTVENPTGAPSGAAAFQVLGTPAISGLEPAVVQHFSPTQAVAVSGWNFPSNAVVLFGATTLTPTFSSPTLLTVTVPSNLLSAIGVTNVRVSSAGGATSEPAAFTVTGTPSVTSINPPQVTAGSPTTLVTISGSSFLPTATVSFAGTSLTPGSVSPNQIAVTIPSSLLASPGSFNLSVINPLNFPSAGTLNVIGLPTIASLVPSSAAAGVQNLTLTVTGSSFGANTTVSFRGTSLTPYSTSFSSVSVSVPADLLATPGTASVTVNGAGGTSSAATFTVLGAPTITSISPEVVPPGSPSISLVINGSNFVQGATVLIGSTTVFPTVTSSSQLSAFVSSSLLATAGTLQITVSTTAGTSNTATFRVQGPATISSLSPSSAPAGSPGFSLTINGSNFGASPSVEFGTATLAPTIASSTQVVVQVPPQQLATTGTALVRVTSATSVSNQASFTITPAGPQITSLNPSAVPAGSPEFNLTIAGSGFSPSGTVRLNAIPVTPVSVTSTQIVITVPGYVVASPGTVNVTVSTQFGESTFALNVLGGFSITSIAPQSVPAGSDTLALTVRGTQLPFGGSLYWNDLPLSPATLDTDTWYVAVPPHLLTTPGTVSIRAQSAYGISSNTVQLQVLGPAISGLSPASASAGSGNLTLTVTANNLITASAVRFNGTALTASRTGPQTLVATVPAALLATPGTVNITVVNTDTAVSAPTPFTILPAPSISALLPNAAGAGAEPFWITVAGEGFAAGTVVRWEGQSLQTTIDNPMRLRAFLTAAQLADRGGYAVTVLTPSGAVSNAMTFTVGASVPAIAELSPKSATAGGIAFRLTLKGTSFSPQSTVIWNGSGIVSTWVSATEIVASVPQNLIASPTTASIWVVNPGGGTSNIIPFNIDPPEAGTPSITATSPLTPGEVGQPYTFTFRATGGATPYRGWAVIAGVLPPGLRFGADGTLAGTPTVAGSFQFTVELTDGAGVTTSRLFTLVIEGPMRISEAGIVNAASGRGGMVAPGELLIVNGCGLGPGERTSGQIDERGYIGTSAGGTRVLFDDLAAPVLYTSAGQAGVVAPYALAARTTTRIQVVYQGRASNVVTLPVTQVKPGIFTTSPNGMGQGAIRNEDGSENAPGRPAARGSIVSIFATGEGQTSPLGVDGKPGGMPAAEPVAQPVMVIIGGQLARVVFAGGAPSLVAGMLQVNAEVPPGVAPGDAVPVVLLVGGVPAQPGVTMAIR
ncbi:MAG: putative Ig domain-containing protein [Bryobacteraceae bacterium]|nr:putative Ig domain-containing protein [Bryobacteraceae bacterium]